MTNQDDLDRVLEEHLAEPPEMGLPPNYMERIKELEERVAGMGEAMVFCSDAIAGLRGSMQALKKRVKELELPAHQRVKRRELFEGTCSECKNKGILREQHGQLVCGCKG